MLTAMRQWGDRWAAPEEGPPVELLHRACGHVTQAVPVCSECGEPLHARAVRAVAGPGHCGETLAPERRPHATDPG